MPVQGIFLSRCEYRVNLLCGVSDWGGCFRLDMGLRIVPAKKFLVYSRRHKNRPV